MMKAEMEIMRKDRVVSVILTVIGCLCLSSLFFWIASGKAELRDELEQCRARSGEVRENAREVNARAEIVNENAQECIGALKACESRMTAEEITDHLEKALRRIR